MPELLSLAGPMQSHSGLCLRVICLVSPDSQDLRFSCHMLRFLKVRVGARVEPLQLLQLKHAKMFYLMIPNNTLQTPALMTIVLHHHRLLLSCTMAILASVQDSLLLCGSASRE